MADRAKSYEDQALEEMLKQQLGMLMYQDAANRARLAFLNRQNEALAKQSDALDAECAQLKAQIELITTTSGPAPQGQPG